MISKSIDEQDTQSLIAVLNEKIQSRKDHSRKKQLEDLLKKILSGDVNSSQVILDKLFNSGLGERREYINPVDRSTQNYNYMEIGEIGAGTPNVW
jgi:hypothetical protein